jgi:hypothetical protein
MTDNPYLQWPVFRRSVVAAFQRSLTQSASSDRTNTAAVDRIEGCAIRALIALLFIAADDLSSAMDRLSSEIILGIVPPGLR